MPPSYRKPYTKPGAPANPQQEVVLGGQVFQSGRGGKSLVRKGGLIALPRGSLQVSHQLSPAPSISRPTIPTTSTPSTSTPTSTTPAPPTSTNPQAQALEYVHAGKNKLIAANRINKTKPRPPPPAVLAAKRARLAKMSTMIGNVQAHRYGACIVPAIGN